MNDHHTFYVETNKARITREALLIKVAQGLNNFFQEICVCVFLTVRDCMSQSLLLELLAYHAATGTWQ